MNTNECVFFQVVNMAAVNLYFGHEFWRVKYTPTHAFIHN